MSKKRIKVFEAGTYPQGEFSYERVKNIFSDITSPVQGIFAHTSKWIAEKKAPVEVGEFSNFSMVGNTVFADVEFNEDGKNFLPILKGVSVEINGDKLTKIAVLPIGVTPAVEGAEFQTNEDGLIFEFEEAKVTIQEIMAALKALDITMLSTAEVDELSNAAWRVSDDSYKVEKLKEAGYTVQKEFSKEEIEAIAKAKGFTLTEFQANAQLTREEWEKQYAVEFQRKQEMKEAMDKFVPQFPPVMKPFVEFCVTEAFHEKNYNNVIEFSADKKVSMANLIKENMDSTGPFAHLQQEFSKRMEVQENQNVDDSSTRIGAYYKK